MSPTPPSKSELPVANKNTVKGTLLESITKSLKGDLELALVSTRIHWEEDIELLSQLKTTQITLKVSNLHTVREELINLRMTQTRMTYEQN